MSTAERYARESRDCCKSSIVKTTQPLAILCLILNCIPFTSGVGTIVSAFLGARFNTVALIFGLLQLLLAVILVGWIWSIVHGLLLVYAAFKKE